MYKRLGWRAASLYLCGMRCWWQFCTTLPKTVQPICTQGTTQIMASVTAFVSSMCTPPQLHALGSASVFACARANVPVCACASSICMHSGLVFGICHAPSAGRLHARPRLSVRPPTRPPRPPDWPSLCSHPCVLPCVRPPAARQPARPPTRPSIHPYFHLCFPFSSGRHRAVLGRLSHGRGQHHLSNPHV